MLASLGLELFDAFDENVAHDGQAFGADLVQSVLGGVPVGDLQVDYVDGGNFAGGERLVIVFDGRCVAYEDAGISKSGCRSPDQVGQTFV